MIKRSIPILIYFLFTTAYSQLTLDYAKVTDVMNQASKSAVFIKTPQFTGTGTLFVVPFTDTSDAGATYVATAKHVLYRVDSLGKIIGSYDTVLVFLNTNSGSKESRKYIALYKANFLDIAILAPIELKRSFSDYDTFVPRLTDIANYSEIKKAENAFIAGYPFGIGAEHNHLDPVIQLGVISLVDSIDSRVLIDIPVNPGNSGCPAYVMVTNGTIKLLGLVFEYEPSREDVVFRPLSNSIAPANTSLGRVVLHQPVIEDLKRLPH